MKTSPVLIDFETRSRADLNAIGGRRYSLDPSTEVLCCAWYDTATGDRGVWVPDDPGRQPAGPGPKSSFCPRDDWAKDWPHHGRRLGAHNAMGFDRFIADALGWDCPVEQWIDTSELARRAGLPGALDALGTRWLGLEKDKDASRFATSLSSVRRPAGKGPGAISPEAWRDLSAAEKRELGVQPEITPEVMARVVPYCELDVTIMAEGWPLLESWADLEPDVQRVDRIVNDRGIYFDAELAVALLECDRSNGDHVCASVGEDLGWTAAKVKEYAMSNDKFKATTGAPNAQAETVAAIKHPLARARQALATIASGKLIAGIDRVSDDFRLRDLLYYYGGHTGRWSSKGMQLHNLPRPHDRYEEWTADQLHAFAEAVKLGKHLASQDEIELLIRATLCASPGHGLAVCDFSGVEARALAWCADDFAALRVFASGVSPYKVMGAKIFGTTPDQVKKGESAYTVGKAAELACGYGMGGKTFHDRNGDALDAAGVDPYEVVEQWRQLHAPSVRMWDRLEHAMYSLIAGTECSVDCFDFACGNDGKDGAVFLPSGRPIVYNDLRVVQHYDKRRHKVVPSLAYTSGSKREDVVLYDVEGHPFTPLYGGKITENLIQALCRDLMADALVRAEDAGLRPVLHVHDEIVCEVPQDALEDGYHELHHIMTTVPEWAEGFPIGAAGFHGKRYRK